MDSNGKVQEKPKIDSTGDVVSAGDKSPPSNGTKDKPKPYAPTTVPEKPKDIGKGLGDEGDKKLIWTPKTKEKSPKNWPNIPEMVAADENKFKENIAKYGNPHNIIDQAVEIASNSNHFMECLANNFHKNGKAGDLLKVLLGYTESCSNLAKIIAEDDVIRQRLNKSFTDMHEVTDMPAHEEDPDVTKKGTSALPIKPEAPKLNLPPLHGRRTKTIGGDPLDMGSSDVVTTRGGINPIK